MEAVHTLSDDTQELQKHLGCMNGIFQIFDRRYLLGQRRRSHNPKKLRQGQSDNGETEVRNVKEKFPKVVTKEEDRISVELPRNSFSCSSSSTAMSSSLDYSKRVQTEVSSSCQSVISESSSSPSLHRKKPNLSIQSPDIRAVVKDSMTREPRLVSIKHVAKDERVGTAMKHIDSPRPFPPQKDIQYDRIKQNLKELKETARFSCDGRDLRYQSKPNMKIKELPRLSLDSRQGYINNTANDPMSNKRPSSSVVARLMGLEALTGTIDETKALKTNTRLNEEPVLNSRSSRKEEMLKHGSTSVSPKVQKPQRGVKVSHVITRIPLEPAPWKGGRGPQKPPFKIKESPSRGEQASRSIYDEIEKRLTKHEYKTAGKDIRALKQILEAMQKAKKRLENKEHMLDDSMIDERLSQKVDQPVSHTTSQCKVKQADARKESVGRNRLKDPNPRDKKVTGRPPSTSNFAEHPGAVSPRLQRSKNSMHGPSSDWSKPKKQPSMQRRIPGSLNRNQKAKSIDPLQDSSETRNFSQQSYTISFQSENDSEVTSTNWTQEVNSPFRPKNNHRVTNNISERLTEETSTVDHAKHTMDQPSPVSVLDAFYTEETPSPVKKKSNAFDDVENIPFEVAQAQDQLRMNKLANRTNHDHYSEFNTMKLESIKTLVHQIELLNTHTDDATINPTVKLSCDGETGDHGYVEEIILASGCLKDLDRTTAILQLHPTVSLINPGLFHVLEKTKACTELTEDGYNKTFMRSSFRRKIVFDTVNDVLCEKLSMLGPFGSQKGRVLTGDKLLKELCSEIDGLQNESEVSIYDEDDKVTNIINADVNKRSQDWDEYSHQVPGVVLDIERLIFKDLISEVVNFQVTGLQDWLGRPHCRRLFTM